MAMRIAAVVSMLVVVVAGGIALSAMPGASAQKNGGGGVASGVDAPILLTVTPGAESATLEWTRGAEPDGGSGCPTAMYAVNVYTGTWAAVVTTWVDYPGDSLLVEGLTPQSSYHAQVLAYSRVCERYSAAVPFLGFETTALVSEPRPEALTISVADASVAEGDEGHTALVFAVELSGSPSHDVSVRVSAVAPSGTTATRKAGAWRDFVGFSRKLTFAANAAGAELRQTVIVDVVGDTAEEADETFVLRVKGLRTDDSRVSLSGGGSKIEATGMILNDDISMVYGAGTVDDSDDSDNPVDQPVTTDPAPVPGETRVDDPDGSGDSPNPGASPVTTDPAPEPGETRVDDLNPPVTVTAISLGAYSLIPPHACALRSDGTIVCWADEWEDRNGNLDDRKESTTVPAGTFKAVSAGGYHICAIRSDDTLVCWGSDSYGKVSDTPSGTFKAVSAGQQHTCAIRSNGTIACWGFNHEGQINAPSGTFKAVTAVGASHSCAIRSDDTLVCWGSDDAGQSTPPDGRSTPPAGKFQAIASGNSHTCAIRSDSTLACWGVSWWVTPPAGKFQAVSSGTDHTCGIRSDGTLACWGVSIWGQTDAPQGAFTSLSAGLRHTCAIRSDGEIVCWGEGRYGKVPASLTRSGAIDD